MQWHLSDSITPEKMLFIQPKKKKDYEGKTENREEDKHS